jgi:hypothetical protein
MPGEPSGLRKPIQRMPDDVRHPLRTRGLVHAYEERPAYQRNDYLSWIARAKLPSTREKRLNQMLDELEKGGVYMNMAHAPSRKAELFPHAHLSPPRIVVESGRVDSSPV